MAQERMKNWLLITVLAICGAVGFSSCSSNKDNASDKGITMLADVAEGHADVMITEITEAPYYVQTDSRLAAPLLNEPFNHGEIGVLMQKGQDDLLQMVNATIRQMKSDGTLRQLHEKYGLVYAYD
jgi:cyclohexadienyl dehydratase